MAVDMMHEIETMSAMPLRGPTKPGERQAAEYLAGRMKDIGLETAIEDYKISPHYYWVYFTHCALAILAGIATIWTRPLWIPVLMAVVLAFISISFWGDLTTKFHLIRNIIPRYPSQNVVGVVPNGSAKKKIIVSAHIDAAKVGELVFNPDLDEALAKFYKEKFDTTPNVMMPILLTMVGLFAVAVVRAAVPSGAAMWIVTWIIQGICTLGLLIATVSFFDIGIGAYVPGACDNLSGIAACMSIAEELASRPLSNCELEFAAFGCEEAIMMGAVQYMKKHGRELDKENTYFINMESLGYGNVRYATSEGFIHVRPYSEELVAISKELVASGGFDEVGTYEVRLGTDAMVPLVRGFKAISVMAFNENNFIPNYHTQDDTPENMDIKVTERARDFAMAIIRELDRS
jgi:acetylornithine deacetylase/succinyl-diaminopimelate desuccinylase-like protein